MHESEGKRSEPDIHARSVLVRPIPLRWSRKGSKAPRTEVVQGHVGWIEEDSSEIGGPRQRQLEKPAVRRMDSPSDLVLGALIQQYREDAPGEPCTRTAKHMGSEAVEL